MDAIAKLLVGLLVAVLLLQLIQHGPGGAARWMRAKFLGDEG